MPLTLTIQDKNVGGGIGNEFSMNVLKDRLTVRELIRARVHQEVKDYKRVKTENAADLTKSLVKPDTDRDLKDIDIEQQVQIACKAFESNQIIILINENQVDSLDDQIELTDESVVSFLKLTQLVGG